MFPSDDDMAVWPQVLVTVAVPRASCISCTEGLQPRLSDVPVDVITVAAINLNEDKNNPKEVLDNYDTITKDKMRLMFNMALKNDCKNIILGAWGCGVFNNNPVTISNMFEEVIMKKSSSGSSYMDCFENIVFAVINDHNSVGDNYDVFTQFF